MRSATWPLRERKSVRKVCFQAQEVSGPFDDHPLVLRINSTVKRLDTYLNCDCRVFALNWSKNQKNFCPFLLQLE